VSDEICFSVVIAAHNASRTLPVTIRSVLGQTRQDFEVLVVDDGSVDGTHAALMDTTTDPRIKYFRQENSGPAPARNAGIQQARGRYVSILDSDDAWLPNYLEAMDEALSSDPAAGLAYTDAWRFDDETGRVFRRTAMSSERPPEAPPADTDALLQMLLQRNFVFTSATMRRRVLEEVGGFRSLTRSEDCELWLRIAAAGHHFVRARGILAVYRDRPGSRMHDRSAMLRGRKEILELVADEYEISAAALAVARIRLEETERELDAVALGAERPADRGWRSSRAAGFVRRLRDFRLWPPAVVAAAVPDLRSSRSAAASEVVQIENRPGRTERLE
jgi:glycosyltransferase involved in cell wall biosynthesis